MGAKEPDWQTHYAYYQELSATWNAASCESVKTPDGNIIHVFKNDNVVLGRVLTEPDNKMIKVIWPPLQLH